MAKMGFAAVQSNIEKSGKSPKQAAAIAAAIGRKKYGNAKMSKMAAVGQSRANKGK